MAGLRLQLITGTAVALTGVACAGTALADTRLGWYVAADAGHDLSSSQALKVTDVTLTSANAGATAPAAAGSYTLKPDYAAEGFARAGYRFTPNLRAEIEVGTRPGTVINGLGSSRTADLGNFDKTSLMANAIFDLRPDMPIHPFVGVGAGMVHVKTGYHETNAPTGHVLTYSMAGDKTVPAGQFLAGASWDVTQSLHFDMTYRYLRTASTSYDVAMSDVHGGTTDAWTAKAAGPIKDQSVSVGLRWTFGGGSSPEPSTYADAPLPAPAAKAQHAGLHFPALSLPFTKSRKVQAAAAPAPVAVAQADPAPATPQAMVPPPSAPAMAAPAPMPTEAVAALPPPPPPADAEADTAPGSDAAATAKEPKRFFAKSARAPGKAHAKAAVQAPPAPIAAPPVPTSAPTQPVNPDPLAAADPAAPAPAQPASAVTSAPLPAAAAPSAKARHFTAYFPLGGARLDDKARSIVADAAQHAQSAPDAHVSVDGYADTSGSAAYNMGLSHRRAAAVAEELKAGGVAEEAITVAWHGETHLAVRTADGVKNARNRRVTIGVHFGAQAAKTHHRHHRRHRHKH
ncbi:OmpA family protein [Asticcacaulis solisilvae]|uniref:OmpA family protein n=1 Tax=Asticcacaulis solisilvae TaxID=1217274 RepID=UPI003FD71A02